MDYVSYLLRIFPNHQSAAERGQRVLNAIFTGSPDPLREAIGEEVVIAGKATSEAQRGVGHDFHCDEIFVRVHGAIKVSIRKVPPSVSVEVCVVGKLLNAHAANRILVLSVKPKDYLITGTT